MASGAKKKIGANMMIMHHFLDVLQHYRSCRIVQRYLSWPLQGKSLTPPRIARQERERERKTERQKERQTERERESTSEKIKIARPKERDQDTPAAFTTCTSYVPYRYRVSFILCRLRLLPAITEEMLAARDPQVVSSSRLYLGAKSADPNPAESVGHGANALPSCPRPPVELLCAVIIQQATIQIQGNQMTSDEIS